MLPDELLCHGAGIDKRHILVTRQVGRIETEKKRQKTNNPEKSA